MPAAPTTPWSSWSVFPIPAMNNASAQLMEPRRASSAPVPPIPWSTPPVEPEDVCFLINAAVGSSPPLTWPLPGARNRLVAELWERPDFLSQFEQLAQRCLDGERQHYEAQFDFPSPAAGERQPAEAHSASPPPAADASRSTCTRAPRARRRRPWRSSVTSPSAGA